VRDFLSQLVERSLAGSSAVRPQLGSIFEPPANEGGTFSSEENREAAVIPPSRVASDRTSRVESLWQAAPNVPVEIEAASPPMVLAAPEATAPALQPAQRAAPVAKEQPAKKDQPETEIIAQDEAAPELHEIRFRKVIDLIRRETPAQRELSASREMRRSFESRASFRLSAAPAEKREVPAEPSINVTIGRVEVRATLAREKAPEKARAPVPSMSLEKYLRERAGGNRK
jgi:hypothetical protein